MKQVMGEADYDKVIAVNHVDLNQEQQITLVSI